MASIPLHPDLVGVDVVGVHYGAEADACRLRVQLGRRAGRYEGLATGVCSQLSFGDDVKAEKVLTCGDALRQDPAVSYTAQSRRVRDSALGIGARRRALSGCVTLFAPYGYTATLAFLNDRCGRLDDPQNLTPAIELLDASRVAWLAQLTAFAAARKVAKADGNRRPTSTELARMASTRWPGGTPTDPFISRAFLHRFGLIASLPEPVRLRRRIRWRNRRLANPPSTSRVEWGYLVVVVLFCAPCVVCSCGLGFSLYDILAVGLWWAGGLVVALAIVAFALGVADNPRRNDAVWRNRMVDERDALQARLDRVEHRDGRDPSVPSCMDRE